MSGWMQGGGGERSSEGGQDLGGVSPLLSLDQWAEPLGARPPRARAPFPINTLCREIDAKWLL